MNYVVYTIGKKSQKKLLFTFTKSFVIVNCHLTAGNNEKAQRASQMRHITDELTLRFNKHLKMIAGDLNCCDESETILGWCDVGTTDGIVRNTFFMKNKYNEAYGISANYRFDRIFVDFQINRLYYKIIDPELSDHAYVEMLRSK
jgi:endonuclease/exonuclease/phosphatase family metal-dependent hydrolase